MIKVQRDDENCDMQAFEDKAKVEDDIVKFFITRDQTTGDNNYEKST